MATECAITHRPSAIDFRWILCTSLLRHLLRVLTYSRQSTCSGKFGPCRYERFCFMHLGLPEPEALRFATKAPLSERFRPVTAVYKYPASEKELTA